MLFVVMFMEVVVNLTRNKLRSHCMDYGIVSTPGRLQLKTLLKIDERGSKIARNSVFDCHLSPVG